MQHFDIFRYLKRFFALVLAVTLAGTAFVAVYCKKNQRYTASVNIKYLHDGIKNGYAPDGSPLNVDEIYSSTVISQAMESLGIASGINIIRSHCSVEEVVDDTQKAIEEALNDKGEESTYFPDEYKVTLVVDGSMGADYARNVLNAIIRSYCSIYTEEYVELPLSLNPSSGLLESGYDYHECISILDDDTTGILEYLEGKKTNYPDFRSSVTGYSFTDLYDIYKMLDDYEIPALYAEVLNGPQVRNPEKLCKTLSQKIEDCNQNEQVYKERQDYLLGLINNYSEKNKELIDYHYHNDASQNSSDYILKQVEAYSENQSKEITYDSLILEYVEIDKAIHKSEIDRGHSQQLLDTFQSGASGPANDSTHAAMEAAINKYEETLLSYYNLLHQTGLEHNQSLSADYLKTTSSTRVNPAINVKIYLVLGFAFFLLAGCALAIFVGRTRDFVDYLAYTDKKTGLPNRDRVDAMVDKLAIHMLPDHFTCFFFQLRNLNGLTKRFGYTVGDHVLKDFADLVRALHSTGKSFIGYNGSGQFIALLDECSGQKAAAILSVLDDQIKEYNALNPEYPMQYRAVFSTSSTEQNYAIRALIRSAFRKLNAAPVLPQDPGASTQP